MTCCYQTCAGLLCASVVGLPQPLCAQDSSAMWAVQVKLCAGSSRMSICCGNTVNRVTGKVGDVWTCCRRVMFSGWRSRFVCACCCCVAGTCASSPLLLVPSHGCRPACSPLTRSQATSWQVRVNNTGGGAQRCCTCRCTSQRPAQLHPQPNGMCLHATSTPTNGAWPRPPRSWQRVEKFLRSQLTMSLRVRVCDGCRW